MYNSQLFHTRFLLQVCFTVFCILLCACFHVSSHYSIHVELKGRTVKLILSFHLEGFEDQIQGTRFDGNCIYPLCHLTIPGKNYFKKAR